MELLPCEGEWTNNSEEPLEALAVSGGDYLLGRSRREGSQHAAEIST